MAQSSCRFSLLATSATYLARVLIFRTVAAFIPAFIAILNIYLDHYSQLPLHASKRKRYQLRDHIQVRVSTILNPAFSAACGPSANSTTSYHLPRSMTLTLTNLFRLSAALSSLRHTTSSVPFCIAILQTAACIARQPQYENPHSVSNSIRALMHDVRIFICFGPIRH